MLKWLGSLVDSNEKELKRLQPIVDEINPLEPEFQKLSDAELRARTDEFKARLKDGETLDDILPEAFAAVREAARRTIGERHFDVQLMGGIALHQGKITEMKTGEGKTLVATLPLYLDALSGDGCHLVTVNDYLARRDAYWMGPIYHALGLTVASIYPSQSPAEHLPARLYDPDYTDEKDTRWPHFRPVSRQQAYQVDITYGTNNEFGFDYLRDNMASDLSQCIQRPLNYAIVDEVDNILIDEARTPLIISGSAEEATEKYNIFARLVPQLKKDEDYSVEEKERQTYLTESGMTKMEKWLRRDGLLKAPSLYDPANYSLTQYLENALKANVLFKRDRDYVVKDGQVIIVDEFTGRLMFGRRYSEGLHQAIEAKEKVKIQRESITLATITFQNYFRLYKKLAGMTGTAATEAEEFHKIYKLEVVVIPSRKEMIREYYREKVYKDIKDYLDKAFNDHKDHPNEIYKSLNNHLSGVYKDGEDYPVQMYKDLKQYLDKASKDHEDDLDQIYKDLNDYLDKIYKEREDHPDQIYKDEDTKFKAVAREIEDLRRQGRPVLIGTVSIEKSEKLSNLLERRGIRREKEHWVLNAKNHEKEAHIIAQAGGIGAVTVATNMAGRGVDIILGGKPPEEPKREDFHGNDQEFQKKYQEWLKKESPQWQEWQAKHNKVVELGGLHVIGTERHEARRIDNQLRGRSGRQLDPGSSRFYVSLEDDVVRRFGGDRVKGFMDWAGFDENTPIEHSMVSKSIENAQVKVEGFHFDVRKHLVDYDDVVNRHREIIYAERRKILEGADLKANILSMVRDEIEKLVASSCSRDIMEPDLTGLIEELSTILPLPPQLNPQALSKMRPNQITEKLIEYAEQLYEQRETEIGAENMRLLERLVMLRAIDSLWKDHLTEMDHLRQQASLQAMRQIEPIVVYKKEGHALFESLTASIQHDVVHTIYKVSISKKEAPAQRQPQKVAVAAGKKVGRNDPCPCGSGKKYKHCCGR
ncbi:MAG: SEC-C domain-containing protein [Dehalococcoidia bacterium]|nr:SEC-C domain-containing protein [Dehalococcoidia bacterium]